MNQRRRHRRTSYTEVVQVVARGRTHFCRIEDLSHGGARIARVPGMADGETVKLFVPLPIPNREQTRFCFFPATIAWSAEDTMGVEFNDVPLETFVQLELGLESIADEATVLG